MILSDTAELVPRASGGKMSVMAICRQVHPNSCARLFRLRRTDSMPQKQKKHISIVAAALVLIGLFVCWYVIAANYDYGALAGTYIFNRGVERCTLDLRSDRTFTEELVRAGGVQKAQGTWRRYGESHVSFSKEFLTISGQEVNADGEVHGEFSKTLGVLPFLTLAPLPDGPKFRKTFLR